ncbi:MAG: hypothetical protein M0026_01700 [Nocardiopsaceae bacterium]|nr:hypothetical protein [Nocardiopsaceae bacterium]
MAITGDGSRKHRDGDTAGCRPARRGLAVLTETADAENAGLVCVAVPGAPPHGRGAVRLERTAAFARARHLGAEDTDLDRMVEEVYGVHWVSAAGILAGGGEAVPEPPKDWQDRLRRAEQEAARERARADRLERRLRWRAPGPVKRRLIGLLR